MKEGWACKQIGPQKFVMPSESKELFIRNIFNQEIKSDRTIDKSRKVSKSEALKRLKEKILEKGWDVKKCLLTEKQIVFLFSFFKQ